MSWKKYFTRARRDADLQRELEAHLAHESDTFLARGMNPESARHAALRKLGNVAALRESLYERNSLSFLESCWQDLRHAFRQLRFSPGYAAVTILSLALGTGVNIAVFQLIDAVRLRSLPVPNPQQLAEISIPKPRKRTGDFTGWPSEFTYPVWEQIRDRQRGFSGVLAWSMGRINLSPSGQARFAQGMWVSGDFFRVLGVKPVAGRVFTAAEDNRDCNTGAVISHAFWQREFAGDPAGKTGHRQHRSLSRSRRYAAQFFRPRRGPPLRYRAAPLRGAHRRWQRWQYEQRHTLVARRHGPPAPGLEHRSGTRPTQRHRARRVRGHAARSP
jgi:hypothetical protein